MTSSPGPAAPRISPPALVDLQPVDSHDLAGGLDGAWADSVDLTGASLREVKWRESRLANLTLDGTDLRGARLLDLLMESASGTAFSAPASTWRDVEVRASRFGGAELYDCTWTSVVLRSCKITYLNLRGTTLIDVLIEDCTIDELDLYGATCQRVAVIGGRVGELTVTGSSLSDVDLRGTQLDRVSSATALTGAAISLEQVLDLAPQLARELGITLA